MATIRFITVGTLKEDYLRAAVSEYEKRLSGFCRVEQVNLKEAKLPQDPSESEIKRALDEEAKQILLQETPALFGILMENNREFTTQTFHELSTAFFLGLNPPKIQALMARLSALRYRPDQQ